MSQYTKDFVLAVLLEGTKEGFSSKGLCDYHSI